MSVVVIGGSRGIGAAIAAGLTKPGTDVFLNYVNDDAGAKETVARIEERGGVGHLVPGDISSPEVAAAISAEVANHVDSVDALIHCAVKTESGPLLEADPAAFRAAVEVNAMSFLYSVQAFKSLLTRGSSIVYLSSRGARMALKGYASVGAPKAMAEAFVRYLAVELAPLGVRVNTLSPTAQDTGAFRDIFPDDYAERLAEAARRSPSGRAVDLDDVVDAARFLVSPASSMYQGQVMVLDGATGLAG
jgi:enoyl-[acyl-carrier protein] reductase III